MVMFARDQNRFFSKPQTTTNVVGEKPFFLLTHPRRNLEDFPFCEAAHARLAMMKVPMSWRFLTGVQRKIMLYMIIVQQVNDALNLGDWKETTLYVAEHGGMDRQITSLDFVEFWCGYVCSIKCAILKLSRNLSLNIQP